MSKGMLISGLETNATVKGIHEACELANILRWIRSDEGFLRCEVKTV